MMVSSYYSYQNLSMQREERRQETKIVLALCFLLFACTFGETILSLYEALHISK